MIEADKTKSKRGCTIKNKKKKSMTASTISLSIALLLNHAYEEIVRLSCRVNYLQKVAKDQTQL